MCTPAQKSLVRMYLKEVLIRTAIKKGKDRRSLEITVFTVYARLVAESSVKGADATCNACTVNVGQS